MKELNIQKIQNKLRNKFLASGVKMLGPETIFFKRSTAKCSVLLVHTAIDMFSFLHQIKKFFTPLINLLLLRIFFP